MRPRTIWEKDLGRTVSTTLEARRNLSRFHASGLRLTERTDSDSYPKGLNGFKESRRRPKITCPSPFADRSDFGKAILKVASG